MAIPQSQTPRLLTRFSELRFAAALLVFSGLILFTREFAMSFPGGVFGPATRLTLSFIFAWALLRGYSWGWWASILVGALWLLMDFMTVAALFGLAGSVEPLYEWPLFPLVGAFVAQAVAVALLLRAKTGLPSRRTLGVVLLGLVLVLIGFWIMVSRSDVIPAVIGPENELAEPIYSAVYDKVKTQAIKVSIGTVNGVKRVRVVIADSTMVGADSATQAAPSRDIAMRVRAVLPAQSDLQFIGIGWSLDTGPGVMPTRIHRFSVDELDRTSSATP